MTIVACPRCRDEVQLPARVSPQARVRCPLCRDEYILSEALAKMPPMLIVLDGGPALDEPDYAEPAYKMSGMGGAMAESGAGAFDSSPAMGESPVSTAPRPMKGGARPKKKSGGAVSQIIQVVLGGVGAFVLFQPLAWYVLKQDPFAMGPIVSKYAPQIVPEKYHGKSTSGDLKGNGSTVAQGGNNGANNKGNGNNTPSVPKSVQGKKGNSFDPGDKFKGLDPAEVTPMPLITEIEPGPTPFNPAVPEVKIDDPLKMANDPPSKFTPPMPKPEDPNATSPVGTVEVNNAYAFALHKREDFEAANAAKEELAVRQQKGKDLYEAAATLGKLCAEADMTEPENEDKISLIKDLALKMTNNGTRFNMLTVLSDPRLADGASEDAIAVAGVIKDVKDLGATTETTVEVTRTDKTLFTVPVVTMKGLEAEGAEVNSTVIVLGKIIRDPKKDLPKYKGESPLVVKAGHVTVVPTP